MTDTKIRVALVYGGRSGEHPISCATAGAVMAALDPARYDVVSIGIRRDGTWVPGETDPANLQLGDATTEVGPSDERVILPAGDGSQHLLTRNETSGEVTDLGAIDVVFPLLHGSYGEDGTIQGLLEMAGLPYVGCGVFASAAAMDKIHMKSILADAGLPATPFVAVTPTGWATRRESILADINELEFPVFVKPSRAGSSLGVSRVNSPDGVVAAIEKAQAVDPRVLVEQGIKGREIECGVLGGRAGERARASTVGEVVLDVPEGEFYDFDNKYADKGVLTNQIPAEIDADVANRVRELAVRAFEAFDCEGLTRVDFFVTDGEIFVNELNTMPGFTPVSMYPELWIASGMTYSELVDELIALALERPVGLR